MKKKLLAMGLAAAFAFGLAPGAAAWNADQNYARSYDQTAHRITYTIQPGAEDVVTISCDELASSLIRTDREPGDISQMQLEFVNKSGRTYSWYDTRFYTENRIDRNVPAADPEVPPDGMLRVRCPVDTGSIGGTRGFDNKSIPYSLNVLRAINRPLMQLYGGNLDASDVTVQQVIGADDAARARGFQTYSQYLLHYYQSTCPRCANAASLQELEPQHIAEIFGTRAGGLEGQTEIRQPRFLSQQELGTEAYRPLCQFGWAVRDTVQNGVNGYKQAFELLETDPELIRLGYWFLYRYGMLFTFDSQAFPIAQPTATETQVNGLEMMNYLDLPPAGQIKTDNPAQSCTLAAFEKMVLPAGQSALLPNVEFSVQLPNAYDDRGVDFGFSVTFVADGAAPPSPQPDPEDPSPDSVPPAKDSQGPVTGDDAWMLWAVLGMILFAIGAVVFYRKRQQELNRKESQDEP